MLNKQLTLVASEVKRYRKPVRREKFLAEMDRVALWKALYAVIEPYYPKPSRAPEAARRWDWSVMLRIHCPQLGVNRSDPAVEEVLYDSLAMRSFVDIDLGSEPVPDETTVMRFRHLLERHKLGERIFEAVGWGAGRARASAVRGRIVGATIIAAPSSTKNAQRECDPQIRQVKKGNEWHFGIKAPSESTARAR